LLKFNNNMGLNPYGYETEDFANEGTFVEDYKDDYKPSSGKIQLAKAFFGYTLYNDNGQNVELNLGRQRLYDLFDSRVMFANRFDGLAFKYTSIFDGIGSAHATWGSYLVDDRSNHYGHAFEVGLADIVNSGAFFKFSFNKLSKENVVGVKSYLKDLAKHNVSQLLVGWVLPQEVTWGYTTKLYAAYLTNHKAKKEARLQNHRHNHAWYAGFSMGSIKKPGDFTFDANWQYVEGNAISEAFVRSGITRGNVPRIPFTLSANQGYVNYHGPSLIFAYQATSDITLQVKAESSREAHNYPRDTTAGTTAMPNSRNKWSNLEFEALYSF
jgi:hypothetical protein